MCVLTPHKGSLELGDQFEVRNKDWLRLRLPTYERLWADFIGHDGTGRALPIPGLSDALEQQRRSLYQAHFTAAKECHRLDGMMKRADERLGHVADAEAADLEIAFLIEFVNCIGRIRDQFKAMDTALKQKGSISTPLQEFYDLRSHLTHGPQPAYFIDEDGLLKIPPIAGRNRQPGEWDDSSHWEDQDPTNFIFAAQFCSETGTAFFKEVNRLHPMLYNAADRVFGGKKVDWQRRNALVVMSPPTGQATSVSIIASGNAIPGSGNKGPFRSGGT